MDNNQELKLAEEEIKEFNESIEYDDNLEDNGFLEKDRSRAVTRKDQETHKRDHLERKARQKKIHDKGYHGNI